MGELEKLSTGEFCQLLNTFQHIATESSKLHNQANKELAEKSIRQLLVKFLKTSEKTSSDTPTHEGEN